MGGTHDQRGDGIHPTRLGRAWPRASTACPERALGSTVGFAIMGSVLAAVIATTLPTKFAPVPVGAGRCLEEQLTSSWRTPTRAPFVSSMGPGKPLPGLDHRAEMSRAAAADDSFVEGIRAAHRRWPAGFGRRGAGLFASGGSPKGKKEEGAEEGEAVQLEVEEDTSP